MTQEKKYLLRVLFTILLFSLLALYALMAFQKSYAQPTPNYDSAYNGGTISFITGEGRVCTKIRIGKVIEENTQYIEFTDEYGKLLRVYVQPGNLTITLEQN